MRKLIVFPILMVLVAACNPPTSVEPVASIEVLSEAPPILATNTPIPSTATEAPTQTPTEVVIPDYVQALLESGIDLGQVNGSTVVLVDRNSVTYFPTAIRHNDWKINSAMRVVHVISNPKGGQPIIEQGWVVFGACRTENTKFIQSSTVLDAQVKYSVCLGEPVLRNIEPWIENGPAIGNGYYAMRAFTVPLNSNEAAFYEGMFAADYKPDGTYASIEIKGINGQVFPIVGLVGTLDWQPPKSP